MHIPVCYQNKYVIIIVFVFEMNVMYIDYVYGCYKHVYGCNACILTVYMDAMYMYIDGVYGCYIHVYECNGCILTVYMDVMYMYIDGVYGCYIHVYGCNASKDYQMIIRVRYSCVFIQICAIRNTA